MTMQFSNNSTTSDVRIDVNANRAGNFMLGGKLSVNRLGYGSMRLTGAGVWGPPPDRTEALRTLRRLADLGVDFIDTADSYGPDIAEPLIREALYPYNGMLIATKGGLARTGPNVWVPLGRPEYLRQQALKSLRLLGLDQLGLWQLHRIDPTVPRDEQFGAIKALLDDGIIAHAGLSEVSVEEIAAASKVFKVATVQNRYNLTDRTSQSVLDYCEQHQIGFIPWFPLAAGELTRDGSVLDQIAKAHNATPSQIALAWLLARSRVMLPIPGTSKVAHLEQNIAAADLVLTSDEMTILNQIV